MWVNEETQMRIATMEKGACLTALYTRLANAMEAILGSLEKEDFEFWPCLVPSNLGNDMNISSLVKLSLLSARPGV